MATKIASRDEMVNCVTPSVIETQMGKNLRIDEAARMNPMRGYVRTEEVSAAVAVPCSYEANYVTRREMAIGGGTI